VVLLPNLYGDILSDVAAQIAGSVGLAGSANIGTSAAMFEAIHGSAPRRAGQDVANPSGLLLGAVQMLVHIGQGDVASRVHNAWLATIEHGIHTYDVFDPQVSTKKVGTRAFADAVIEHLGSEPSTLKPVRYGEAPMIEIKVTPRPRQHKEQVGIDVFVDTPDMAPNDLGAALEPLAGPEFRLDMISNRGQKVYPDGLPETLCVDHQRCRFMSVDATTDAAAALRLMARLDGAGFPFIKTEGLFTFDGVPGYSKGQGQ